MQGYFLVKFENVVYANCELYKYAVAQGERGFRKLLIAKKITGKYIFDQVFYPVTPEQRVLCNHYAPVFQDFDDEIRYLNVVSKKTLNQLKEGACEVFRTAYVITLDNRLLPNFFKYKYITFFKARDWDCSKAQKYNILRSMATIKLCGFLYIALNAVDVRIGTPTIATLKK